MAALHGSSFGGGSAFGLSQPSGYGSYWGAQQSTAAMVSRCQTHSSALGSQTVQPRRAQASSRGRVTLVAAAAVPAEAACRFELAEAARAGFAQAIPPDVSIVCRTDIGVAREVRAHRTMLQFASPYHRTSLPIASQGKPIKVGLPATVRADCDVVETFLCHIYPVYPKPDISWDNVCGLVGLAHEWKVDCVLSTCEDFLLHNLFVKRQGRGTETCASSTDGEDDEEEDDWDDVSMAKGWLRSSESVGLPAVAQLCIKQLVHSTSDSEWQQLVSGLWLGNLAPASLRMVVGELLSQQDKQQDAAVLMVIVNLMLVDSGSPSTTPLRKVIDALLSQQDVQHDAAVLLRVARLLLEDGDTLQAETLQMVVEKLAARSP